MIRDANELLDFWKRALPVHDCLYFRGAIPEDKLRAVCKIYGLVDPSRILLLYDDTVFGGGGDGFILTASHFGFKGLGEDAQFFAFNDLQPGDAQFDGQVLTVRGQNIEITGNAAILREGVARALRQTLQGIGGPKATGPYRKQQSVLPPHEILATIQKVLPEHEDVYYRGQIPARMLRNVVKLYEIAKPEDVLVLYDDTIFGSAKEGLVVTVSRVCFKGIGEGPVSIELRLLNASDVSCESSVLTIKGRKAEFTGEGGPLSMKFGQALQKLLPGGRLSIVR